MNAENSPELPPRAEGSSPPPENSGTPETPVNTFRQRRGEIRRPGRKKSISRQKSSPNPPRPVDPAGAGGAGQAPGSNQPYSESETRSFPPGRSGPPTLGGDGRPRFSRPGFSRPGFSRQEENRSGNRQERRPYASDRSQQPPAGPRIGRVGPNPFLWVAPGTEGSAPKTDVSASAGANPSETTRPPHEQKPRFQRPSNQNSQPRPFPNAGAGAGETRTPRGVTSWSEARPAGSKPPRRPAAPNGEQPTRYHAGTAPRRERPGPAGRSPQSQHAPDAGRRLHAPDISVLPPMQLLAPRTARELAFNVLEAHHAGNKHIGEVFDQAVDRTTLSPSDRRLAYELICGIVRRQSTLQALLMSLVHRQLETLERPLQTIIKIGLYQIFLCQGIPQHAAVHETVELAKRANMRWGGFVNGVLRSAIQLMTENIRTEPSSRALPIGHHQYRELTTDLFPSPTLTPGSYIAAAFSFPHDLVERWVGQYGVEVTIRMAFWFNQVTETALRVNLLKTDRETFRQKLFAADFVAEAGDLPETIRLLSTVRISTLPGFSEGEFSVQDLSAQHAARRLNPQPGEVVLDLCAAPGSKTCHMAELMQNQGEIIAADTHGGRIRQVYENAERLGLSIIRTITIGPRGENLPSMEFDKVLADVPCSNTGVLGKRPEARWKYSPAHLDELREMQATILRTAAGKVRIGGRILYSTCSIEPLENEEIVQQFLAATSEAGGPQFRLVEEQKFMPGSPADGAYQALIERVS